jgi:hypothetical protein
MEVPTLMTWERKILRKVQVNTQNDYWRIKINKKNYNKFKSPGIVTVDEVCCFEWFGYVARTNGER